MPLAFPCKRISFVLILFSLTAALLLIAPSPASAQSTAPALGYADYKTPPAAQPPFPTGTYCVVATDQKMVKKFNGSIGPDTEVASNDFMTALASCGGTTNGVVEITATPGTPGIVVAPFTLAPGETLQIDAGATMFASLNPCDYQWNGSSHCPEGSDPVGPFCGYNSLPGDPMAGFACNHFITVAPGSGSNIIGYGVIDGRADQPLVYGYSPYNARTIGGTNVPSAQMPTSCSGEGIPTNEYSWYCLNMNSYLTKWTMTNTPRLIVGHTSNSFTLNQITLRNSPFITVRWEGEQGASLPTANLVAWGVKIYAPFWGRNTDGIDPVDNIRGVYIGHTYISNGDDNSAISSNAHTSQYNLVSAITYDHLYTYSGLGISIGSGTSGGISDVLYQNIYMAGSVDSNGLPQNNPTSQTGIHIKSGDSNGGKVDSVTYNGVCIANQVDSIVVNGNIHNGGDNGKYYYPTFSNIVMNNIHVLEDSPTNGSPRDSGAFILEGYDGANGTAIPADIAMANITVDDAAQWPEGSGAGQEYPIHDPDTQNLSIYTFGTELSTIPAQLQNISDVQYLTASGGTLKAVPPSPCDVTTATFPDYDLGLFISTGTGTPSEGNTNLRALGTLDKTIPPQAFTLNAVIIPTHSIAIPTVTIDLVDNYSGQTLQQATITTTNGVPNLANGTLIQFPIANNPDEPNYGIHGYYVKIDGPSTPTPTRSDGTVTAYFNAP